jgi:hypothetical protein
MSSDPKAELQKRKIVRDSRLKVDKLRTEARRGHLDPDTHARIKEYEASRPQHNLAKWKPGLGKKVQPSVGTKKSPLTPEAKQAIMIVGGLILLLTLHDVYNYYRYPTYYKGKSLWDVLWKSEPLILLFAFAVASMYSTGEKWDKVVTFFIYLSGFLMFYIGHWFLWSVFGFAWDNWISILYYLAMSFFWGVLLYSRYTKNVNIVTVFTSALAIVSGIMLILTLVLWSSLDVCAVLDKEVGVRDPWYIWMSIYLLWVISGAVMVFAAEMPNPNTMKWMYIAGAIPGIFILGYSWYRCKYAVKEFKKQATEEEREETAIKDEPRWLNHGVNIGLYLSLFTAITSNNIASLFFAFIGFGVLDQCAPQGDLRKTPFSILFFWNVGAMMWRYFTKSKRATLSSRLDKHLAKTAQKREMAKTTPTVNHNLEF